MKRRHTSSESRILKAKAKDLFEVQGLSQKNIAATLEVSEKTVGSWKVTFGWNLNSQRLIEQKRAKQLIVILGYNQKDTAEMVGVSQKTIGTWTAKYKWIQARETYLKNLTDISSFVYGFNVYVMHQYEPFAAGISSLVNHYHQNVFLNQQDEFK